MVETGFARSTTSSARRGPPTPAAFRAETLEVVRLDLVAQRNDIGAAPRLSAEPIPVLRRDDPHAVLERLRIDVLAAFSGYGPARAQTVEEGVTIGSAVGPVEESFQRIAELEVARDGRIAVVDEGDGSVLVLDPEGRFLLRFGGSGEGPAEFGYIGASALAGDTLVVLDREGGKLAYFALDGTLLRTRRTGFSVSRHGFPARMHALGGGDPVLEGASGCSTPPRQGEDTQWRLVHIPADSPDPVVLRREARGDALAVYAKRPPLFCAVLDVPSAPPRGWRSALGGSLCSAPAPRPRWACTAGPPSGAECRI